PKPGRVKTRLSPPLSPLAAADIYEACLRDVLAQVLRGPRSAEIRYRDEPAARAYFARAFPGVSSRAQPAGDLGHRLEAAFEHAFARGDDRVIVLGSDAPTLPDAVLDEADAALADADAVLGPASDGGYYLVGVRARAWPRAAALFEEIPWSTRAVWRMTLKRAAAAGLRIAALRTWYDIDRPGDLGRARRDADADSHLGRLLGERTDLVGARDAV
ncbi:MAG: TIGR04282 family arsenosugar biosynthesis glycosyltransferase, partial [Gemmatimonadota bacterium]